jgi:hypothetical protein
MLLNSSRAVNWLTVHRFVKAVLNQVNGWPMAGTAAWSSLNHADPAKWCALLDAAQHHALRVELNQTAIANASHDISASQDWAAVSREYAQLQSFRAANPWSKREAS